MSDYSQYEKRHLRNIGRTTQNITDAYNRTADAAAFRIYHAGLNPHSLHDLDRFVRTLSTDVESYLRTGIHTSWDISNAKINSVVDKRLRKLRLPPAQWYQDNPEALRAFTGRSVRGVSLSHRVWTRVAPFRFELEKALAVGIARGDNAAKLASDIKTYLNEPDQLFRRVRDAEGTLQLSRSARNYTPGKGVYRSSYKNALRLAVTETNMASRVAELERYRQIPFIIGYKIELAPNHKHYDICDQLRGVYPKDFIWRGWHPFCLCWMAPVLLSDRDYDKLEDYILGLNDAPTLKQVTGTPQRFQDFVQKNYDKFTKAYWAKDNPQFFKR